MKLTRQQFEALALEHIDTLYRVARRLTRDQAQAEDLVQEAYLRALRAWESFDLRGFGIRPWLIRILRNVHLTRAERQHREPIGLETEVLHSWVDERVPPAVGALFEQMDERVVRALERLSEEYRVVLLLWAVEDMSYKEIAEALEVPIGTVMSRLHRARQRLVEDLQAFAKDEGMIRE